MIKAVIYARYSSHNQREESIEGQLRKCYEYAERNGFDIIEEYCDRALTGTNDNRAAFQKMIKDSEKGLFSAIIMYTLDRFARNRYDSAVYKAKLRKNGVKLYYTEQAISDEPEGIILESVLEGMAEYYSQNLSRGVKRGMRENAMKCMITGGYVPLGYKKTLDKKYEINPATAPIIEEIFDLYTHGHSQRQVADALNAKGYRTTTGRAFTVNSLATILTNKKYIGVYSFEDIEIEGGIPAIISKDVFERAQMKMKINKRESGKMKAPEPYLLTGKVFCGLCGSPMLGESGTSRSGEVYNYYKCYERKKNHNCTKHTEKKAWLERLVVENAINKLKEPNVIENIAERAAEISLREYNDNSQVSALKETLSEIEKSIKNLLKLVEKGLEIDDVCDRLLDLNAQKSDLQHLITKEERKKKPLTKEKTAYWLTSLVNSGDINDIEYQQRIIDTLVNKVYVFDTDDGGKKIVCFFNLSANNTTTITFDDAKRCSETSCFGQPKNGKILLRILPFLLFHCYLFTFH